MGMSVGEFMDNVNCHEGNSEHTPEAGCIGIFAQQACCFVHYPHRYSTDMCYYVQGHIAGHIDDTTEDIIRTNDFGSAIDAAKTWIERNT